jgi:hypothetical protein
MGIIKWQPPGRNLGGEGQLKRLAASLLQVRYLELAARLC